MDAKDVQRFLKEVIAGMQCTVCGSRYQEDMVHIVAQQGDLLVARVTCAQCHTQGLIFATLKEGELNLVGELAPEEGEAFRKMSRVGIDDVLDMHLLLRNFEGDLKELLEA